MVHFFSFLLTCFNIEMHINIFLSCKNMFNIAVSIYNLFFFNVVEFTQSENIFFDFQMDKNTRKIHRHLLSKVMQTN